MHSTLLLLVSHHLHIFASPRHAQIVHALLRSILLLHGYQLFLGSDAKVQFSSVRFFNNFWRTEYQTDSPFAELNLNLNRTERTGSFGSVRF